MAIRFKPASRVKKTKSSESKEILARLQNFLEQDAEDGELVRVLRNTWKDQRTVISYEEIRQIISDGTVSKEMLRLWSQDYSRLVMNTFSRKWMGAAAAGAAATPLLQNRGCEFNSQSSGVFSWLNKHGGEFVTSCVEEQRKAISALVTKKMVDGHTVDELANLIRPCIGLNEPQAKANARFYDNIVESMKKEHPRMKEENIQKYAQEKALKYAEQQHRGRAMTIAMTESAYAYNWGADEGIRQAQMQGLMGEVVKRWNTSGDGGVCKVCSSLEGTELGMDEEFGIRGRELFSGHHKLPPAHPRCACTVEYIEVSPPMPMQTQSNILGDAIQPDYFIEEVGDAYADAQAGMQKLGEIDTEKTEEALKYYGDLIREDSVENVVIIDKAGNLYHASGGTANINISGIDLAGASITHNHPLSNGILSFGKDDFIFLRENPDVAEMQAVNKYYTYSAVPLDKIKEISYYEIYREALILAGETEGEDLQHLAMEVLAEKGGVVYARKAVE